MTRLYTDGANLEDELQFFLSKLHEQGGFLTAVKMSRQYSGSVRLWRDVIGHGMLTRRLEAVAHPGLGIVYVKAGSILK